MNISTNSATAWNGPVCHTCGRGYMGVHECSPADLWVKVNDLLSKLQMRPIPPQQAQPSYAELCPCNPARGGSGLCGCVLGGIKVTC